MGKSLAASLQIDIEKTCATSSSDRRGWCMAPSLDIPSARSLPRRLTRSTSDRPRSSRNVRDLTSAASEMTSRRSQTEEPMHASACKTAAANKWRRNDLPPPRRHNTHYVHHAPARLPSPTPRTQQQELTGAA
eukprot:1436442-Pyramimonas_sp.AAC.1